jgi:DNA-binding transcriptional regulator YiaG
MSDLTPMAHIRRNVFGLTQEGFAQALGVTQPTISKWETEGLQPDRAEMAQIRQMAADKGLKWDDRWFWEVPQVDTAEASDGG